MRCVCVYTLMPLILFFGESHRNWLRAGWHVDSFVECTFLLRRRRLYVIGLSMPSSTVGRHLKSKSSIKCPARRVFSEHYLKVRPYWHLCLTSHQVLLQVSSPHRIAHRRNPLAPTRNVAGRLHRPFKHVWTPTNRLAYVQVFLNQRWSRANQKLNASLLHH